MVALRLDGSEVGHNTRNVLTDPDLVKLEGEEETEEEEEEETETLQ